MSAPRPRGIAWLGVLFRAPVPETTLLSLAGALPEVANALGGQTAATLGRVLGNNGPHHLLIRDTAKDGSPLWSCHPVLRDHFRRTLLGWGTELLQPPLGFSPADRPASVRPASHNCSRC